MDCGCTTCRRCCAALTLSGLPDSSTSRLPPSRRSSRSFTCAPDLCAEGRQHMRQHSRTGDLLVAVSRPHPSAHAASPVIHPAGRTGTSTSRITQQPSWRPKRLLWEALNEPPSPVPRPSRHLPTVCGPHTSRMRVMLAPPRPSTRPTSPASMYTRVRHSCSRPARLRPGPGGRWPRGAPIAGPCRLFRGLPARCWPPPRLSSRACRASRVLGACRPPFRPAWQHASACQALPLCCKRMQL